MIWNIRLHSLTSGKEHYRLVWPVFQMVIAVLMYMFRDLRLNELGLKPGQLCHFSLRLPLLQAVPVEVYALLDVHGF
jgi:hypothetical protein